MPHCFAVGSCADRTPGHEAANRDAGLVCCSRKCLSRAAQEEHLRNWELLLSKEVCQSEILKLQVDPKRVSVIPRQAGKEGNEERQKLQQDASCACR